MWSACCCPSACIRISTTSTRSAAGPTTWAMRSAIPRKACACWPGGASELQAMCAGQARHPVFVALAGTVREFSLPVQLFDDLIHGVRAGPDRHALPELRGAVRVLPLFRESGGTAGAGAVRISRRRTAGAVRRHLHGAAAGQFLAGRHRGSGKRPGVSAARSAGGPRLSAGGAVRAPVRSGAFAPPCRKP